MEKHKKPEIVAKIAKNLGESEAVFLLTQNKMSVSETQDLRKQLRAANSSYYVSKNTLIRLAVKDSDFSCILPHLSGQTAVVFSSSITESSKVIQKYSDGSDGKISVVCGGYGGNLLNPADIKTLSKLPSMDELRAKIVAVIQTPAQRIATIMSAPASQLARVTSAYSQK